MTDSGMKQLIIFHVRKNLANKIFTVEKCINGIFKLILTHLRKLVATKGAAHTLLQKQAKSVGNYVKT